MFRGLYRSLGLCAVALQGLLKPVRLPSGEGGAIAVPMPQGWKFPKLRAPKVKRCCTSCPQSLKVHVFFTPFSALEEKPRQKLNNCIYADVDRNLVVVEHSKYDLSLPWGVSKVEVLRGKVEILLPGET